jgi:hypothetical protein
LSSLLQGQEDVPAKMKVIERGMGRPMAISNVPVGIAAPRQIPSFLNSFIDYGFNVGYGNRDQ